MNPSAENNSSSAISIKGATLKLDGHEIIHDFSWEVARGEHWFVLGPNGAGKTTLVKMILGMVWPLFGAEVSVLGNRYGRCNINDVRKKIAWASPFLSAWTSEENGSFRWTTLDVVLSGLDSTVGFYRKASEEERAKAVAALERMNASRLAEHYYDRLSSGEQMKALIARALIAEPELVILDETCVYLDLASREYLLSAIDALARAEHSPAIIFITQRIEELIPSFDRGLILSAGRVMKQGMRSEILDSAIISEAFGVKVSLDRRSNGRFWPVLE